MVRLSILLELHWRYCQNTAWVVFASIDRGVLGIGASVGACWGVVVGFDTRLAPSVTVYCRGCQL